MENKNTLYVVVALVIGLVVGYFFANSNLSNNIGNQEGKALNSATKNQVSIDQVKELISKYDFLKPGTMYDLRTVGGIAEFNKSLNLQYYDLTQGQMPTGSNERPVTCYVYGMSGYVTGWSSSSGQAGYYNLGGSMYASCFWS